MMMQNVMITAKVRGLGPCHERMESSSCSRAEQNENWLQHDDGLCGS